uniref:Uncharacterized protein n=1 Tax=Siphoviridae sp. ctvok7 TaxID=2827596 RepID=A0A8S5LM48_9CAUD|nr:MAG TPA: hypothetical protein [Siphoviridae sp. ctvok7]
MAHTSSQEKDVSPLSLLYSVLSETPILLAIEVFLMPLFAISAARFGNATDNSITPRNFNPFSYRSFLDASLCNLCGEIRKRNRQFNHPPKLQLTAVHNASISI